MFDLVVICLDFLSFPVIVRDLFCLLYCRMVVYCVAPVCDNASEES